MGSVRVQVDRSHIAYRPPFHVETFKSGFAIGCDAGGVNCVRFPDFPGAIGGDAELVAAACAALNEQPISTLMIGEIPNG